MITITHMKLSEAIRESERQGLQYNIGPYTPYYREGEGYCAMGGAYEVAGALGAYHLPTAVFSGENTPVPYKQGTTSAFGAVADMARDGVSRNDIAAFLEEHGL